MATSTLASILSQCTGPELTTLLKNSPAPASSPQLICHIGVQTRTWVSLCSAPFTFLSRSVNLSQLWSLSLRLCLSLTPSGAVSLFSTLCLCLCVSIWLSLRFLSLFLCFPAPSHRLVCFLTVSCSLILSAALRPQHWVGSRVGVAGDLPFPVQANESAEPFTICYLVMGTAACGVANFSLIALLGFFDGFLFSFFFLFFFFWGGLFLAQESTSVLSIYLDLFLSHRSFWLSLGSGNT